MKNKMTEEQYLRALDCCVRLVSDCYNCPYYDKVIDKIIEEDFDCEKDLKQNIVEIIKNYHKENLKLRQTISYMQEQLYSEFNDFTRANAEGKPPLLNVEEIKELNLEYKFIIKNIKEKAIQSYLRQGEK